MNNVPQQKHSNTVLPAIFLANMMSATATWAVDINGEITPGIMRYTYQEDFTGSDDVKWQDNVPFLGAGLGATWSVPTNYDGPIKTLDLFGDIYGQWVDTGDDRQYQTTSSPPSDKNIDFKRRDYVATLGATIPLGKFSTTVSLGYKGSTAELNGTHRWHPSGVPARISVEDSTTLKSNGGFGGISLAWAHKSFSVTGNVAYTWLNSKYDNNMLNVHEKGDNEGLTYGLRLRYALNESVALVLSGDYYSYETGLPATKDRTGRGSSVSSVKEKMVPVRLSITYRFYKF